MALLAGVCLMVLLSAVTAFNQPLALRPQHALCSGRSSFSGGKGVVARERLGRKGVGMGGVVMMAKKKLSAAQQAALAALEQFEAAEAPVDNPAFAAPVVMKKEKKKKKKKAKKGDLEAAIEAPEESVEGAAFAPPVSPPPKMSKKKAKHSLEEDLGIADFTEESTASVSETSEAAEVDAVAGASESAKEVVEEEEPEWKQKQKAKKMQKMAEGKQTKGKKKKGGVLDDLDLGDDDAFGVSGLDGLFGDSEDDGRRAGKKKKGKKDKKDKKGKKGAVAAEIAGEEGDVPESAGAEVASDGGDSLTLEQKAKKNRPPPRIRIESGVQPGYVSVRLDKVNVIFKNQQVCTDCSWGVQTGDRVGLVGANGGGKTTQLRVMYGELEPTSGEVIKSAADLRISFLRQEFVDELVPSRTLREELMSVFAEEMKVFDELDNYDKVLEQVKDDPDKMQEALDRMADLQKQADSMGVAQLASRVEKIMDLMGFAVEEGENLVASFSGGWKMRIGLGKILLTEPNLLLLDEPTNHLDLESIEWMEQFLINQKIPMVIVSHDREFLDRVCTKTVDCDGGTTTSYDGNYSRFLKLKAAARESWQSAYDNQMKRVKQDKDFINRFKSGAQASQAASRQKKLDKLMASDTWVKKPPTLGKPLRFRFPPAPRLGDGYAVVRCQGVSHGYPEAGRGGLFDDVNLTVEKGERIAFLGPNGCGKSTFMRLVAGKEEQNEGTVEIGGENVLMNYYEQNQADVLDLDKTVLDTMKYAADGRMEYEEIRALLGQFLFKGDTVNKKLGMLSGGEKARVALCTMMLSPANLLVLDEPTNHLDIPAKEMLEEALQYFDGTVLVISHDRYFVSQVANTICAFEDSKMVRYNGDYKFYMDKNEEWKEKVENRYVDGVEGIKNLKEVEIVNHAVKKNFGGSAVTSGKKDKGVKNAKRLGD